MKHAIGWGRLGSVSVSTALTGFGARGFPCPRSSLACSSCPPLGPEDHCRPLNAAHPPRLDDASPILRRKPHFTSDQGIVSLRSIDIVRFAGHCGFLSGCLLYPDIGESPRRRRKASSRNHRSIHLYAHRGALAKFCDLRLSHSTSQCLYVGSVASSSISALPC